MTSLETRLKRQALTLGFALTGIAEAGPADHFDRLREWLERGYAGEMGYLHKHGIIHRDIKGNPFRPNPTHTPLLTLRAVVDRTITHTA